MPVRFYLYPMPNKKGECPIRVSVSIGSTRFMTGIGYIWAVEVWEDSKGYCKKEYINKYKHKFKVLEKPVIFLVKEELLYLYKV